MYGTDSNFSGRNSSPVLQRGTQIGLTLIGYKKEKKNGERFNKTNLQHYCI